MDYKQDLDFLIILLSDMQKLLKTSVNPTDWLTWMVNQIQLIDDKFKYFEQVCETADLEFSRVFCHSVNYFYEFLHLLINNSLWKNYLLQYLPSIHPPLNYWNNFIEHYRHSQFSDHEHTVSTQELDVLTQNED